MEKYTRGVSAVETILTLDRQVLRQTRQTGAPHLLCHINCSPRSASVLLLYLYITIAGQDIFKQLGILPMTISSITLRRFICFRLRQSVAVKELLNAKGKLNLSNEGGSNSISEKQKSLFMRKTVSVPNMSHVSCR